MVEDFLFKEMIGQKMPKVKTNSAAKKRFKKTAKKKIKFTSSMRRHLLTKKTRKSKRQMRKNAYISQSDMARLSQLIPY